MKKDFSAKEELNKIITWVRAYFSTLPTEKKAVVRLSPSPNDMLTAAVVASAIEPENVIAVIVNDDNTETKEANPLIAVCEEFGMTHVIMPAGLGFIEDMELEGSVRHTRERLDMTVLYAIAEERDGIVINSSDLSHRMMDFHVPGGMLCGDIAPLHDYTYSEVVSLAKECDIPVTPEMSKEDETELDLTFEVIDAYLRRENIPTYTDVRKIATRSRKCALNLEACRIAHPVYNPYAEEDKNATR